MVLLLLGGGLCIVASSQMTVVLFGRYLKRGVNDSGCVANEVETEQVVNVGYDWRTGFPTVASHVQVCEALKSALPGCLPGV